MVRKRADWRGRGYTAVTRGCRRLRLSSLQVWGFNMVLVSPQHLGSDEKVGSPLISAARLESFNGRDKESRRRTP